MQQMEGRVVLITGAARGQGRSHAIRFAEEGADVIATDICADIPHVKYPLGTAEDLAETVQQVEKLGRRCLAYEADARDSARMNEVIGQAVGELGRLDTVIVNHGIGILHPMEEPGMNDVWDIVIETNLSAVWRTIAATIPHLKAEGGSILVTGSGASLSAIHNDVAYVAAKHGLVGMVKSLAADLAKYWIRVNLVCPTCVNTPLILNDYNIKMFCPDNPDATFEDMKFVLMAMNDLRVPWVEPRTISDAMLFLAADTGKMITGISLPVDAGMTSIPPGVTEFLGQRLQELGEAAGRSWSYPADV